MGRVRTSALVALAMVATVLVVAAPPLVSPASGQVAACAAGTFAELDACVVQYNGALAGATTSIELSGNIIYSGPLTDINNGTDAKLDLDGNGFTLDADGDSSGPPWFWMWPRVVAQRTYLATERVMA